jgi:hypothetical protein
MIKCNKYIINELPMPSAVPLARGQGEVMAHLPEMLKRVFLLFLFPFLFLIFLIPFLN